MSSGFWRDTGFLTTETGWREVPGLGDVPGQSQYFTIYKRGWDGADLHRILYMGLFVRNLGDSWVNPCVWWDVCVFGFERFRVWVRIYGINGFVLKIFEWLDISSSVIQSWKFPIESIENMVIRCVKKSETDCDVFKSIFNIGGKLIESSEAQFIGICLEEKVKCVYMVFVINHFDSLIVLLYHRKCSFIKAYSLQISCKIYY